MSHWRALHDNDLMPFGKYKGQAMVNVPAQYLLWLKEQGLGQGSVLEYIRINEEVLKQEIENSKKK